MSSSRNVSITSKYGDKIIVTQLDLMGGLIYVSEADRFIFTGDIGEFKRRVALKQDSDLKNVYEDMLSLAEEVIDKLSKN